VQFVGLCVPFHFADRIQAYLSRFLHSHLGLHVLALDSNDIQTRGAERWAVKAKKRQRLENATAANGSLAHKTIHITAETLHAAINDWMQEDTSTDTENSLPIPILLVALHACGSLTPDILRAFVTQNLSPDQSRSGKWKPVALVTVGCCYNLMAPGGM